MPSVLPLPADCIQRSSRFAKLLIQPLGLGTDFCDAIYKLLTGYQGEPIYPLAGAVIDARGITTNLTCFRARLTYQRSDLCG